MDQIIEQIKDPQTKMMAQLMAKQQKERTESQPPETKKLNAPYPPAEKMRADIQELIRMNKALIQEFKVFKEQHEQLKKLNATVASALGACECWGNPLCPICHGEGKPGNLEVHPVAFNRFAEPLFQKLIQQTALVEEK